MVARNDNTTISRVFNESTGGKAPNLRLSWFAMPNPKTVDRSFVCGAILATGFGTLLPFAVTAVNNHCDQERITNDVDTSEWSGDYQEDGGLDDDFDFCRSSVAPNRFIISLRFPTARLYPCAGGNPAAGNPT